MRSRKVLVVCVPMTIVAAAMLVSGCGGGSTAAKLRHDLLSVSDLPAGWSAVATTRPRTAANSQT